MMMRKMKKMKSMRKPLILQRRRQRHQMVSTDRIE